MLLFDIYAAVVLIALAPRLRLVDWTRREKNAVRLTVVVLIAVNWIFLLSHRTQF